MVWVITLHKGTFILIFKTGKLALGRELAVNEKECHFEEGRVFSQLLDGDSSIFEDTFVTIDVAYLGGVANGVHVSRVIDSQRLSIVVDQLADSLGINEE